MENSTEKEIKQINISLAIEIMHDLIFLNEIYHNFQTIREILDL